jgi:hypothetical protein
MKKIKYTFKKSIAKLKNKNKKYTFKKIIAK